MRKLRQTFRHPDAMTNITRLPTPKADKVEALFEHMRRIRAITEVIEAHSKDAPDLLEVLSRYVSAYPAFRMKPVGAPGSDKRIEQQNLMALEDTAQAAIVAAKTHRQITVAEKHIKEIADEAIEQFLKS